MAVDQRAGTRTAELQAERERLVAPWHRHGADLRRARARRAPDRRRRARVHRLRRRHRHAERRPHARARSSRRSRSRRSAYLHQCYSIAQYEPFLEVCRRLIACHPGTGPYKALLVNTGAEATENAIKIARYHTGRQAVVCFENAFHGRTLLGMTLTSKAMPYKKGFGPFAPEVYRAQAPYPYRGIGTAEALASVERLFKSQVDPSAVAAMIYEPVQGEGGFHPATEGFVEGLIEICAKYGIVYIVGRGAVRHVPHRLPGRRRPLGRASPTCHVGQVDGRRPADRRRHRPRRDHGQRPPGRPRRHVRRQPAVVRGSDRRPRPGARPRLPGGVARVRRHAARRASTTSPPGRRAIGEVRGLGAMLAIELVDDRETKAPAAAARRRARSRSRAARA